MGEWEEVFGAGYTFEDFEREYLRDDVNQERRYVLKGEKNRKKKIASHYIRKRKKPQEFTTYQEAIRWAKKNPGRSIIHSDVTGGYREFRRKNYVAEFFKNEKKI